MTELTPQTEKGAAPADRIRMIEGFGRRYVRDFLAGETVGREAFLGDSYEALKFFFRRSFYRGQRDEVSDNFRQKAFEVLDEKVKGQDLDDVSGGVLEEQLWHNGVNNATDRRMVRQTIDFTQQLPERNIVRYAIEKIKSGQAGQAQGELTGIFGVGDKIASFYLRDVALVFGLEEEIAEAELKYFQPVDTWVLQVSVKLAIITGDVNLTRPAHIEKAKEQIIGACRTAGVSTLLFKAGAWYAGAYSLELLLAAD